MSQPRKILVFVDQRIPLALSTNPGEGTIAPFYQGDIEPTELYFYTSDGAGGLTALDLTDATPAFALEGGAGTPTGTLGDPGVIVYQNIWTYDPTNKKFSATVNYNTQEVSTFLGSKAGLTTTLSVKLFYNDGSDQTVLQVPVTLNAEVIESNVNSLAGLPAYYIQTTTPTGSIGQGSLWLNTNTATLSVYDSGSWDTLHP